MHPLVFTSANFLKIKYDPAKIYSSNCLRRIAANINIKIYISDDQKHWVFGSNVNFVNSGFYSSVSIKLNLAETDLAQVGYSIILFFENDNFWIKCFGLFQTQIGILLSYISLPNFEYVLFEIQLDNEEHVEIELIIGTREAEEKVILNPLE